MVQSIFYTSHPDSEPEADNLLTDSPLFTLASVLAESLKDVAHETVPTLAQGMSPEIQIPYVGLETPSRELSPLLESKHPTKPSTPHHPTIDQLIQELARLASCGEQYAKIYVYLRQESKELHLQVRTVEDLNKAITSSHDSR